MRGKRGLMVTIWLAAGKAERHKTEKSQKLVLVKNNFMNVFGMAS
jgi:hypothetical protein